MTWYRTYRPKRICDLHLTSVRESLLGMMKTGNIPQVLLFAGPKGTGKTSASRILGALLNDKRNAALVDHLYFKKAKPKKLSFVEPDVESDFAKKAYSGSSFVVQEMDAASHRCIDDVRSLKERVQLPPQEGKMSVYILDEAHMLTTEAFNALLKLLEEPPAHTMFILATTEFHKIPATIVSRATTVNFRKASIEEIYQALEQILKSEKIKYKRSVLEQIAQRADGSFRDAVKLLELACQSDELTQEIVDKILGSSLVSTVTTLINAVLSKDEQQVCQVIADLRETDVDQKFFYKSLFNFLHTNLMRAVGVEEGKAAVNQRVAQFFLNQLLIADLGVATPIPFLPLELKLLEIVFRSKKKNGSGGSIGGINKRSNVATETKKSALKKSASVKNDTDIIEKLSNNQENINPKPLEISSAPAQDYSTDEAHSLELFARWQDFIKNVKEKNNSLAALLSSAKPVEGVNGLAKIGVFYRFHQEQLSNPKFLTIIEDCSQSVIGKRIKFEFVLQDAPQKANLVEAKKDDKFSKMAEEVLM